jgi:protocatechuate 3,4-dioxygenase alpha subunit
MEKLAQTPSQTIGPFFAYGLCPAQYSYDFRDLVSNELIDPKSHTLAITISGQVFDGDRNLIPDAMVEIWQDDGKNRLFGRCGTGTDPENRFIFHTIKPLPLNGQAPHLTVVLFMRGQLIHAFTRLYFSDEEALNKQDEVLKSVPAERRESLIAQKTTNGYLFNIYMQGENETVFFNV